MAVGGFDGGIYVKNINTKSDRKEEDNSTKKFTGHQGVVNSVRFLNTNFMISASFDSVLLLWDINSQGKFVSSYHDHSSEVSGLDVCEDNGNIFATGSGDTTVKLWDVREKKPCVATFKGSDSSVNCVKFLPGRLSTIAAGSEDSVIRLYDWRALKELAVYKKKSGYNSINSIGFSKSGQILFASSNDSSTINFWNLFDDGTTCYEFYYVFYLLKY
jgi:WD40 repeat protein